VFLLRRGSLQNRLDPYYYQPKFLALERFIKSSKLPFVPLRKKAVKIFSGITPLSGGDAYTSQAEGVAFVRSGDFSETNTLDFGSLNYIKPEVHSQLMKSSQLEKGDLLIAIVGATIGKVGLYNYNQPANINQAVCGIRLPADLQPEFAQAYLMTPIGQMLLDRLKRPVARANINLEEIGTLQIPLLPLNAQAQVVAMLNDANTQSQQQRAQARAHLADLDTYLAQALGITLPPGGPVPLTERQFRVRFRQVAGQRLDPLYYLFDLNKLLADCVYPIQPLGPLCRSFATGFAAGHQGQTEDDDPTGIIQIRPTNISADRQLVFTRNIHIGATELADRPDQLLQPGEVLFNNTNSQELVGKSVLFNLPGPFCCSNHITRLTLAPQQLDPYYLAALLNLYQRHRVFYSLCTNWNNQSGINADVLRTLRIPVPPLVRQQEIAAHLQAIQLEAQQLEQAANDTLAQARLQIEKLILQ
jgi:type I restriction enzyme S subunit